MIYKAILSDGNRQEIIDYICTKKAQGTFRVVDVGGTYFNWSAPYVDAIIDFNDHIGDSEHITHFKCDITHPKSWQPIIEYVHKMGKFDFCICTHTLEDIMNPGFVCEQMSAIAHSGYIAFPSKYRELARIEGNYRGHIHHRWIFTIKNNTVIGFPKIGYLENSALFDSIADANIAKRDLSFYWKDTIEMVYVNNNFLGPDIASVIGYYNMLANYDYL